jgi:hypothetical protein
MTLPWGELALFMIAIAFIALYSLTVSGHFPAESRATELQTGIGAMIIWGTLLAVLLATVVGLSVAFSVLPWPAITIAGGAMVLVAPLLLRPLPDRIVNGPAGLLTFATGAVATALILWATA